MFRLIITIVISLTAKDAFALAASTPISAANGTISCPTCTTTSTSYNTNTIIYGTGTGNATSAVAANTLSIKKYLSQISTGTPVFEQPQISELQAFSSANLATALSDETGTGTVVFSTGPSINNITLTGTVTLPAGAIDGIADIDAGIKSGGAFATKIVTTTRSPLPLNNCAKWDINGNLVDAGTTCGGTQITPVTSLSSLTPVVVATPTPVYLSLSGDVSTVEEDVQTPFKIAATFGGLQCVANSATTNAITAFLGTGACGSPLTYTSKAQVVMSASANTTGTSTLTTTISAGNCAAIKLTIPPLSSTDSTPASIHCSMEKA